MGASAFTGSAGAFLGGVAGSQINTNKSYHHSLNIINQGSLKLGFTGGVIIGSLSEAVSAVKRYNDDCLRGEVRKAICEGFKVDPRAFDQIDKERLAQRVIRVSRSSLLSSFGVAFSIGYSILSKTRAFK
jgi:hypothetical protein